MSKPDTKSALMDAAETLVRARGPDGFSFGDLAEVVGIRKASIHYHFPTKGDLLAAMMARYSERVLRHLEESRSLPDPRDRLRGFVDVYRSALQDGASVCLCVSYAVAAETLDAAVQDEMATFRAAVLSWLRGTLAQLAASHPRLFSDPAGEAAGLLAQVEGAQLQGRIARDPAQYDRAMRPFLDRLAA